jgi:hypothetical protein
MMQKQDHCIPTCAIPSRPAKQGKPSIWWQQAMSSLLVGSTKMLVKAHVPEVVPSSTNHGDRPNEERRAMMR